MKDLTKWWIDYLPLNNKEQEIISKFNTTTPLINDGDEYSLMEITENIPENIDFFKMEVI